jgi:hypothetical protein
MIKYGKIDGACHGKNVWDDYYRGLIDAPPSSLIDSTVSLR